MTKGDYEKLIGWFRKRPKWEKVLVTAAKWLPVCNAALYLGGMIWMLAVHDLHIRRYLLVPAALFLFVTVFRAWLNRPRPYDTLEYRPIGKSRPGKGKSFPSRHTASAFMIALAFCYCWWPLGVIMLIIAAVIGATRVCMGVHYPSDVIAGAVISLLFSIAFWI